MGTTGGDKLAIALKSSAEHRGPIAATLDDLAETLATEAGMDREIEAKRGESRVTVRMVTSTIIAVVALGSFDRAYASPYQTPVGLAVLAAITGMFALVFAWMRRLIAPRRQTRLLQPPATRRRR
jgi:Flp pilus assembly protein TadB